jgi:hypothetical protein
MLIILNISSQFCRGADGENSHQHLGLPLNASNLELQFLALAPDADFEGFSGVYMAGESNLVGLQLFGIVVQQVLYEISTDCAGSGKT